MVAQWLMESKRKIARTIIDRADPRKGDEAVDASHAPARR